MTKTTAIRYLKTFFSNSTNGEVSLPDIYTAFRRNLEEAEKNKKWLENKVTYIKRFNLIKPKYDIRNNRRILVALTLTEQGQAALNSPEANAVPEISPAQPKSLSGGRISLEDIMGVMSKLREQYPQFEINFDVKLKSG